MTRIGRNPLPPIDVKNIIEDIAIMQNGKLLCTLRVEEKPAPKTFLTKEQEIDILTQFGFGEYPQDDKVKILESAREYVHTHRQKRGNANNVWIPEVVNYCGANTKDENMAIHTKSAPVKYKDGDSEISAEFRKALEKGKRNGAHLSNKNNSFLKEIDALAGFDPLKGKV
jgi:hypothetical protein